MSIMFVSAHVYYRDVYQNDTMTDFESWMELAKSFNCFTLAVASYPFSEIRVYCLCELFILFMCVQMYI